MVKRIVAVKTINRTAGKTEYSMPGNFGGLYRVWRDGKVTGKYQWKGRKIVIPERDTAGTIEVEYFKIPETINAETTDDTEFEVEEDAAQAMPFFVAAQHLFPDLVVDYSAYMNQFERMLQSLDTRIPGNASGGGVTNSFYRGA